MKKKSKYQRGGIYDLIGNPRDLAKDLRAKGDASNVTLSNGVVLRTPATPDEIKATQAEGTARKIIRKKELERRRTAIDDSESSDFGRESFQYSAAGDKLRFFPEDPESFIDDYLNPFKMVGDMADNIGHSWADPKSSTLQKVTSIAAPLALGAIGGAGAKSTSEFVNNLTNPLAGLTDRITNSALPNLTYGLLKEKRYKDLANLYTMTVGAELSPVIKHIPYLKNKYKDLAYKYASHSGGAPSISFERMQAIKKGTYQNIYNGNNAMQEFVDGVVAKNPRDLLKEYIYGNQPGFKFSNEVPRGLEAYQKKYGDMNIYEMNSEIGNGNPISSIRFGNVSKEKTFLFDDMGHYNPINPTDDIAGHMGWVDHSSGRPELVSQDIWKFTPEDYMNKWATGMRKTIPLEYYLRYKQAKLMDNAGKPFITMSRNPIVGVTPISVTPNIPDEIVFKKGGSISQMGYRDDSPYRRRKSIEINTPEGLIDMSNTGVPLYAEDETGFGKYLPPYSGMHQFKGTKVTETRMQDGGLSPQKIFDFIFDEDEKPTAVATPVEEIEEQPVAEPIVDETEYDLAVEVAMEDAPNRSAYKGRMAKEAPVTPYEGKILSDGKYGSQNVGQYGKQIYGQLTNDLGYAPVANSIYRDVNQQKALVAQGVGAKNSYHLTGNAVDIKPEDWNKLPTSKKQQYKNNYDVLYHNNHYHIEPKGTPTKQTGNDKGSQAFNYLVSKGLPNHVAAGMVGNFIQESGNFRDDVINDQIQGDNGAAHGIAQWHGQRWQNMIGWNKARGKNPFTLEAQLDFAVFEADQRGDLKRTMQASNSEEAANIFAKHYERPKIIDPNRANYAKRYAKKYGGEVYNELFKTK